MDLLFKMIYQSQNLVIEIPMDFLIFSLPQIETYGYPLISDKSIYEGFLSYFIFSVSIIMNYSFGVPPFLENPI